MVSVEESHCCAWQALLEAKADPNATDHDGASPLIHCVRAGNAKGLRFLLSKVLSLRCATDML